MARNKQIGGEGLNAGFYLRVRTHIRSLGLSWRKKEFIHLSKAETGRQWSGLAEWLRAAHSLLDQKTVGLTSDADRASQVRAID